jgi:hypothetical protein
MIPNLCDLTGIANEQECTEVVPGIPADIYVARKSWLATLPQFKNIIDASLYTDFVEIDDTPGFTFITGKAFILWGTVPDAAQHTFTSNGDRKGFTQTLVCKIQVADQNASAAMRAINNAMDRFFVFREGDKFVVFFDPERNSTIQIEGDSGTTPDSDSGITLTATLQSRSPKTYYTGTISTVPATGT